MRSPDISENAQLPVSENDCNLQLDQNIVQHVYLHTKLDNIASINLHSLIRDNGGIQKP